MQVGTALFSTTQNVNFKGEIIDSHVHTGKFMGKKYGSNSLDLFVKRPLTVQIQDKRQKDTVSKMLISNLDCMNREVLSDETSGNVDMMKLCKKNKKFFPIAVCEPDQTNGDSTNIRNLLNKYKGKFVGLKFHPEANGLKANDLRYDSYLDVAAEKNLPCIFHSQVNIHWQPNEKGIWFPTVINNPNEWSNSDPEFIYQLAKRHPSVPVIMAHTGAGGELAHKKAIDVLVNSIDRKDANLYCDISWMDFENGLPEKESKCLVKLIKELKERNALDKILFGSDAPLGCYGEKPAYKVSPKKSYEMTVSTFKTVIKDNFGEEADDIIQKIFYDNANKLFFNK